MKEMEMEITEHDLSMEEDPFLLMGYGINAFFDLVISLMKLCFVLTLFVMPMLIGFGGFGGAFGFRGISIRGLRGESKYFMN